MAAIVRLTSMSQTLPRLDDLISETALVPAPPPEPHRHQQHMRRRTDRRTQKFDVDIVLPVLNEEKDLEPGVRRLRQYLDESFPFAAQITIAEGGSTDRTPEIASYLSRTLDGVRLCTLDQKGKGLAVRTAWSQSSATFVAYMDVDLSTGLDALLPLVAPLLSGHSDLSIGTRLARGAEVIRGPKRELISRCYNLMVRLLLHNNFSDACCGFKAMRRETAEVLLPLVADNAAFFDTEMLVLAERNGLRIHEVPVDWVDTTSGISISNSALVDLKGLGRLVRDFGRGGGYLPNPDQFRRPVNSSQLGRFAKVGFFTTLTYFALFFLFIPLIGVYAANFVGLAICTATGIAAHGRFTFVTHGPVRLADVLFGWVCIFLTNAVLTTLALVIVSWVAPGVLGRVIAIMIATGISTLARFLFLQAWIFRRHDA
jgi:glycosyltransferase involved in cell wall biosynthesis